MTAGPCCADTPQRRVRWGSASAPRSSHVPSVWEAEGVEEPHAPGLAGDGDDVRHPGRPQHRRAGQRGAGATQHPPGHRRARPSTTRATPTSASELDMPSGCGSGNIDGTFGTSEWKVALRASATGSTVWVGDEWTVTFQLVQRYANNPYGNDGPDPLNLELKPTGPGRAGARHRPATYGAIDGVPSHDGAGFTGPKSAIGAWGYGFDANSSPKAHHARRRGQRQGPSPMRATAEGVITLPTIHVGGYDEHLPGRPGRRATWTSAGAGPSPVRSRRSARPTTPSSTPRTSGTPSTTSRHGSHRIRIPVLANDDDPNTPGGVGDLDELGISDWSAQSTKGGEVLCGPIKGAGQQRRASPTSARRASTSPSRASPASTSSTTSCARAPTSSRSWSPVNVVVQSNSAAGGHRRRPRCAPEHRRHLRPGRDHQRPPGRPDLLRPEPGVGGIAGQRRRPPPSTATASSTGTTRTPASPVTST